MRRVHPVFGYLGVSALYGFVRGWKADYRYDKYHEKIVLEQYNLKTTRYMDKLVRGLINATLYGSFGNGHALYRLVCRTEILLTGRDPYAHPEAYMEVFDSSITLIPKIVEV